MLNTKSSQDPLMDCCSWGLFRLHVFYEFLKTWHWLRTRDPPPQLINYVNRFLGTHTHTHTQLRVDCKEQSFLDHVKKTIPLDISLWELCQFRTRKLSWGYAIILKCSRSKTIGFWQSSRREMSRGVVFFTWPAHLTPVASRASFAGWERKKDWLRVTIFTTVQLELAL